MSPGTKRPFCLGLNVLKKQLYMFKVTIMAINSLRPGDAYMCQ